jgi:K+-sensing histidine kinase KdpD
MASIISSSPRLRDYPTVQPNLRLVAGGTPARSSLESAKSAVMACLTATGSGNGELLRKAQSAALESGGEFYAVLIDPPRMLFGKAQLRALIDDAILAGYLGARIVWLESSDVVGEVLQLAHQSGVGRIFVSRNEPARFFRPLARSVYSDLLSRAENIRIDVAGFERRN